LSATRALGEAANARIAGHYGLVHRIGDPFGGAPFLGGEASTLLARMIFSTPFGAVHVTEDFATAFRAESPAWRLELVGELPAADVDDPIKLYSLHR